ncbi:MAG: pyruvate kinase [Methylophilaceae bacterium]|nr:pyruvate kinase [Methylophilaceae bacterium]
MGNTRALHATLPPSDGLGKTYAELLQQLCSLRDELAQLERSFEPRLTKIHPRHRSSAINLVHYLGLRRHDVRPLQAKLAAVGLSSLGRSESHVLANLNAMIILLQRALGVVVADFPPPAVTSAHGGAALLETNTNDLLGNAPPHRWVRIMVTLPGQAEYAEIRDMLAAGMDCARINCAHDTPAVWKRLIDFIRQAERETGRRCKILMDLAGPKLRTGDIAPGPAVLKWRPRRDLYGKVVLPARIWLHPEGDTSCPAPADACLPVQGEWLAKAAVNDRIEFTDARGALRCLRLVGQVGNGFWAESSQTAYVVPGIELHLQRMSASGHPRHVREPGVVGDIPPVSLPIRLHRGDILILTREPVPGEPAQYDTSGRLLRAARISCSLPEVFDSVKPGERILFDDGRIGGVIRSVYGGEIQVEITQAHDNGEKLMADKGINLPDSRLTLAALTEQDISHLAFIARHADMVGLSFMHRASDVEALQHHLQRLGADNLGIVLKIETRAAFEDLPGILLAALGSSTVGVMIARGDLAVECGYERLAELQEEILWLAEAAHLPVIWATQVLEGLAKDGTPSRAEITDAAMGERAECVMLNKGPHILEAIRTLDDILQRMQGHQRKKNALLRQLHW